MDTRGCQGTFLGGEPYLLTRALAMWRVWRNVQTIATMMPLAVLLSTPHPPRYATGTKNLHPHKAPTRTMSSTPKKVCLGEFNLE